MPYFGSHLSIAGGYYKAVDAAEALSMDCVQLFTKNNNQWNGKPITPEDIKLFRDRLEATGIHHPIAHDSYLINLASPVDELWQKSIDAFTHELERAEMLGLIGVVMHPGSYVSSTPEEGLRRIVEGLDEAHRRTPQVKTLTLLETTAGQGTNLGHRFEHLREIIQEVENPDRVGVCVDTCHIFAAGYPLIAPEEYEATMLEFDTLIGIDRIKAFHLNDSLKPFGSRVDRHEHIGRGTLGLEPFRHLVNDSRFEKTPMYLETAKGIENGEELDAINLRTLKGLIEDSKTRKIK
ncbi:MAG: deoxyribonuclease IV [Planctomycetaceae bacterium]|nr:deoxyribonuclease IV [Planctomycetaceae bacterium]